MEVTVLNLVVIGLAILVGLAVAAGLACMIFVFLVRLKKRKD